MLEDLLLVHTLRPAQKSYLNSIQPRDIRNPDIPAGLTESLLAPLTQDLGLEGIRKQYGLNSAAHLFSLAALESWVPTPHKSRSRNSWLHLLFCQLTESAGTLGPYEAGDDHDVMLVTFTRMMLETAAQTQVRLESATIKKILKPLLNNYDFRRGIEWDVISLCMELDATIFLGLPEQTLVNEQVPKHVHNELLVLLLAKLERLGSVASMVIIDSDLKPPDGSIYKSLFTRIFAPLARAFIQVRDFSGFFIVWQQELCEHYLEHGYEDRMSIWEDDSLIETISWLVESATPTGTADCLLHSAEEALEGLVGLSSFNKGAIERNTALLVTIECWLMGCTGSRALEELEGRVLGIHQLLLKLMAEDTERPTRFGTRCWRILALINDKWSISQHSLEVQQGILLKAFLTINRISVLEVQRYDYSQELEAFRFMLSLAEAEKVRLDVFQTGNSQGERVDRIGDAIMAILDHSNDRRRENPLFFLIDEWSGQDGKIVTGTDFGLACCAQLVAVPRTIESVASFRTIRSLLKMIL